VASAARGSRPGAQGEADLASMRLDKASTTEDRTARSALLAQVNETVALLSAKDLGDAPITLRLQGGRRCSVDRPPKPFAT